MHAVESKYRVEVRVLRQFERLLIVRKMPKYSPTSPLGHAIRFSPLTKQLANLELARNPPRVKVLKG